MWSTNTVANKCPYVVPRIEATSTDAEVPFTRHIKITRRSISAKRPRRDNRKTPKGSANLQREESNLVVLPDVSSPHTDAARYKKPLSTRRRERLLRAEEGTRPTHRRAVTHRASAHRLRAVLDSDHPLVSGLATRGCVGADGPITDELPRTGDLIL